MSIASKVIGYLGSVFGLYPRSGGGIIIRQPGGVAGTDEAQFTHDGTNFTFTNKDASNALRIVNNSNGSQYSDYAYNGVSSSASFTVGSSFVVSANSLMRILRDTLVGFNSSTSSLGSAIDAGFKRLAAGVLGIISDESSTAGWLQNTAARSRVNSAVTNTTITPAAITGLSHTLIAGRKYTGRLVLYAAVPTSADGIRIDFDGGTATMTSFVAQGVLSDDTSTRKLARTTALATDITDTDLNGDGLVTIELGFVCNAAGTFIPRVAKEADAAGATLTVLANSFLWLEDMP